MDGTFTNDLLRYSARMDRAQRLSENSTFQAAVAASSAFVLSIQPWKRLFFFVVSKNILGLSAAIAKPREPIMIANAWITGNPEVTSCTA